MAGAQVKGSTLAEVSAKAIELSKKYIKESDEHEANLNSGR